MQLRLFVSVFFSCGSLKKVLSNFFDSSKILGLTENVASKLVIFWSCPIFGYPILRQLSLSKLCEYNVINSWRICVTANRKLVDPMTSSFTKYSTVK